MIFQESNNKKKKYRKSSMGHDEKSFAKQATKRLVCVLITSIESYLKYVQLNNYVN